jgi:hypothetical protein
LKFLGELQAREVAARQFGERGIGLRSGRGEGGRLQNLVGPRFHLERALRGRECARLLRKAREGVEDLAAPAAANLASRRAQRFGREPEDRIAF